MLHDAASTRGVQMESLSPALKSARTRRAKTGALREERLRVEFWRDVLDLPKQELVRFAQSISIDPGAEVIGDQHPCALSLSIFPREHS